MQNTSGMTHGYNAAAHPSRRLNHGWGGKPPALPLHQRDAGQPAPSRKMVEAMMVNWRNRGEKCRGNGIPQQVCVCAVSLYNFFFFLLSCVVFFFSIRPQNSSESFPNHRVIYQRARVTFAKHRLSFRVAYNIFFSQK